MRSSCLLLLEILTRETTKTIRSNMVSATGGRTDMFFVWDRGRARDGGTHKQGGGWYYMMAYVVR